VYTGSSYASTGSGNCLRYEKVVNRTGKIEFLGNMEAFYET
jgi:hypothetical protein